MKNNSTSTFTSTMPALKLADSLIPQTRMIVISATIANARKLKMIGMPPITGALPNNNAYSAGFSVLSSIADR